MALWSVQSFMSIIVYLISILEKENDLKRLMNDKNGPNSDIDSLFTLLMREVNLSEGIDFRTARRIFFGLLATQTQCEFPNKFHALVKQILKLDSFDVTSKCMKELIRLVKNVRTNFIEVLDTIQNDRYFFFIILT